MTIISKYVSISYTIEIVANKMMKGKKYYIIPFLENMLLLYLKDVFNWIKSINMKIFKKEDE